MILAISTPHREKSYDLTYNIELVFFRSAVRAIAPVCKRVTYLLKYAMQWQILQGFLLLQNRSFFLEF
jgi:hypothetical protein